MSVSIPYIKDHKMNILMVSSSSLNENSHKEPNNINITTTSTKDNAKEEFNFISNIILLSACGLALSIFSASIIYKRIKKNKKEENSNNPV